MNNQKNGISLPLWAIIVDGVGSLIAAAGLFCYLTDTALLPELGKNSLTLGIIVFGSLMMAMGMADLLYTLIKRRQ